MAKPTDPQQKSQQQLQQALEQQQKNTRDLDRVLWVALPILAFILSIIFANWNIASTIGTAVILTLSFISVGIKKKSLAVTLSLVLLYCLVDNYFSYGMRFDITGLKRQLFSMLLFISIVGLTRSFFDRSMMKKSV